MSNLQRQNSTCVSRNSEPQYEAEIAAKCITIKSSNTLLRHPDKTLLSAQNSELCMILLEQKAAQSRLTDRDEQNNRCKLT